jgi:hypothetical protein
MDLNDAQKAAVRKWAQDGCGLSEIQQRLSKEFGLSLTYMDVRFLVIDLGISVRDRKSPPSAARTPVATAANAQPDTDAEAFTEEDAAPFGGTASVRVEVDRVTKAGSLVSGKVTFSDGVTATWMLDQLGRLGIGASRRGYTPSQADIGAFQAELRKALETRGF